MVVPPKHPKVTSFSRKTHGRWGNPPFSAPPKKDSFENKQVCGSSLSIPAFNAPCSSSPYWPNSPSKRILEVLVTGANPTTLLQKPTAMKKDSVSPLSLQHFLSFLFEASQCRISCHLKILKFHHLIINRIG